MAGVTAGVLCNKVGLCADRSTSAADIEKRPTSILRFQPLIHPSGISLQISHSPVIIKCYLSAFTVGHRVP